MILRPIGNQRDNGKGPRIAQHRGIGGAGQNLGGQVQTLAPNRAAHTADHAMIGQPRPRGTLAHRMTAQDNRLGQQTTRPLGQINFRAAVQVRILIDQGFLWQPVQPPALPHRCAHGNIGGQSRGGIGTLGRLCRRRNACPRPNIHLIGQMIAPRQPARCVQKHHLWHGPPNTRQHRLGRTRLRQIAQTDVIAAQGKADHGLAIAALHCCLC